MDIEVDPELRSRIEAAAAEHGLPIRDDVVAIIRRVVDEGSEVDSSDAAAWSRLSVPVFARDWESDAPTRSTTNWRRGDVVLVPVRFTDGSGTKRRPAVVVSSDRYGVESPDVMIASRTSNLDAVRHPGDHVILDWRDAGLPRPSFAQAKIVTVDTTVIGRRLGRLSAADMEVFDRGLRTALGLS